MARTKTKDTANLVVTTFRMPKPVLAALKLKSLELTQKRGKFVPVTDVVIQCIKRAGIEV